MLLSDRGILDALKGPDGLVIRPYKREQLQPASYDVTLGNKIQIPFSGSLTSHQMEPLSIRPYESLGSDSFTSHDLNSDLCIVRQERVSNWASVRFWSGPYRDIMGPFTHGIWLKPNEFILGSTEEYVEIPAYLASRLNGKSTLGRWGLTVHVTAGFIDPGFCGNITLEIKNEGPFNILLEPGMRIGQLDFQLLDKQPAQVYKGKYQGQTGAEPPKPTVDAVLATLNEETSEID